MVQQSKELVGQLEYGEFGKLCRINPKFEYLPGDITCIQTWQKKLEEIQSADLIVVEWDGASLEGLFQLGMAFALRKRVVVARLPELSAQKSFQNMITVWQAFPRIESNADANPEKITFLICPVRKQNEAIAKILKPVVHDPTIYYPARDTNQDDLFGLRICADNRAAIEAVSFVKFVWDGQSQGCIFDLGMAFALGKPIEVVHVPIKTRGPSFQNFVVEYSNYDTLNSVKTDK